MTAPDSAAPAPHLIDARGLNCPLPLLKLRKAMATQPAALAFTLLATDADSTIDIRKLAAQRGYALVTALEPDGALRFELSRAD